MSAYNDLIDYINYITPVEVQVNLLGNRVKKVICDELYHSYPFITFYPLNPFDKCVNIASAVDINIKCDLSDEQVNELGKKLALLISNTYKTVSELYNFNMDIDDFINYHVKGMSISLTD